MKKQYESDKTIDFYNRNAESFKEDTVSVEFDSVQNMLLKNIPDGAHILDLGCGAGRDAKAFMEKGYRVTMMDGSEELCKIASEYTGQEAELRRFEELDQVEAFDAVWACSSILHLDYERLELVMKNISKALKTGGYLYASFKYGDFEGERNGRYFIDFTEESFESFLKPFKELSMVELAVTPDARPGRENEKWLNVVVRKLKTDYSDSDYAKIKAVKASYGGYSQGYCDVEIDFKSGSVSWEHFVNRKERMASQSEIDKFIKTLKKVKVLDWKAEYIDSEILDGDQWSVELFMEDEVIRKGGSNDYPDKWNEFRKAVSKIIGTSSLWSR